jgi:hypothetical protein
MSKRIRLAGNGHLDGKMSDNLVENTELEPIFNGFSIVQVVAESTDPRSEASQAHRDVRRNCKRILKGISKRAI